MVADRDLAAAQFAIEQIPNLDLPRHMCRPLDRRQE
jgi:hypothetical protein